MNKLILHVTRYASPDTWEFDDLDEAVGFAMEGMYECNFAIDRITDEFGETILTDDEILNYEDRGESVDLDEFVKYRAKRERPKTVFSDRMIQRLVSEPMTEIYKDCSLYYYGYETDSYMERVLAKNLHAGCYPFEGVSAEAVMGGTYTRLEVVSNTDLFCYMSADIGNTGEYPMCMSNTCAAAGSTTRIVKFSVG